MDERKQTHWLVDCTDDRESGPGEPPEQVHHTQRALGVETGRRLVAEQNLRLADDFDGNRDSLSLLSVESSGRRTDDGVLKMREVEKIKHVVDVGELLPVGDRRVLPQQSGEHESFPDGRPLICRTMFSMGVHSTRS